MTFDEMIKSATEGDDVLYFAGDQLGFAVTSGEDRWESLNKLQALANQMLKIVAIQKQDLIQQGLAPAEEVTDAL